MKTLARTEGSPHPEIMLSESSDFTGKLLIAMPGMSDPRFEKSVIFVCAHSDEGAMGLIINKPAEDLRFSDMLEQLSITPALVNRDVPVHFGGPVEHGRGFVLHTADYLSNTSTLEVDGQFGMTASLDILEDIARGKGPAASVMALGYAGWGPGQLENEIAQNGWLTCDATPQIVFATEADDKWEAALKTLGVDALTLSAAAGRA